MNPTNELNDLLRVALCEYSSDMPVSAEALADTAVRSIDPTDLSPRLIKWAGILELRQLARQILRREYGNESDIDNDAQYELFDSLQDRYPGAGNNKGSYIPRDLMTIEDYEVNIARLRNEASAKLKHADALERELNDKLASNAFGVAV